MAWKVQHDLALYCFDFTSYHFPSHLLCFSNSILAIPQTCLTCSCLRASVFVSSVWNTLFRDVLVVRSLLREALLSVLF